MNNFGCSTISGTPCAKVVLTCGANLYPLDRFESLSIEAVHNGTGRFRLLVHEDDLPDQLLDCCCNLQVHISWPEIDVIDFLVFSGRITEKILFDKNTDILSFEGESLEGRLRDVIISYPKDSDGSVKCCPEGSISSDNTIELLAGTTAVDVSSTSHCKTPITTYTEIPKFRITQPTTIDLSYTPCPDPQFTSFTLYNEMNCTVTDNDDGKATITPTAVGAFSFDIDQYCDGVLTSTTAFNDVAIAYDEPKARNLTVSPLIDEYKIDIKQNDTPNPSPATTQWIITASTNITIVKNENGLVTVKPLASGAWSFDYTIYNDNMATTETATVSGTSFNASVVTYEVTAVTGATIVVAGKSLNITPIADTYSFTYQPLCNGVSYPDDAVTVTGKRVTCLTAVEAAYAFANENLVAPLPDRKACADDTCWKVTVPTYKNENYCGTGSFKNLFTQLESMARAYDFSFHVSLVDNCYVLSFEKVGRDLRDLTISECLGNIEINKITSDCLQVKTLHILGLDDLVVTHCIDNIDCGREAVYDASKQDNSALTLKQRTAILTGLAKEKAAELNRGDQYLLDLIWNCSLLPFRDLWLGDTIYFEFQNATDSYRVDKMILNIKYNDGIAELAAVLPVIEKVQ